MRRSLVGLFLFSSACFQPSDDPTTAGDDADTTDGDGDGDGESSGDGDGDSTGDGDTTGDGDGDSTTGDGDCPMDMICAAEVPDDWTGPIARFEGDAAPTCPASFPTAGPAGQTGLTFDDPACSSCDCGDPSGIECLPPTLELFGNSNCNGTPQSTFQLGTPGECDVFVNASGAYGAWTDPVGVDPGSGSCAASGGELLSEPPAWTQGYYSCAAGALGPACDEGVCAPAPPNPFESGLCIYREGDVACPSGPYSERTVWYQQFDDERSCSSCTCSDPSGASCETHLEFFYDNTCTDVYLDIDDPGSGGCTTLWGSPPSSGIFVVDATPGGECQATGGEPEGTVTPAGALTLCCS